MQSHSLTHILSEKRQDMPSSMKVSLKKVINAIKLNRKQKEDAEKKKMDEKTVVCTSLAPTEAEPQIEEDIPQTECLIDILKEPILDTKMKKLKFGFKTGQVIDLSLKRLAVSKALIRRKFKDQRK